MIDDLNRLEKSFANLLYSQASAGFDWKGWFYRNGLPSWRFKNYLPARERAEITKWSQREKSEHKRQIKEYELLYRVFEENGFSAVLFKSCGFPTDFPFYLYGNLDVLVKKKNLRKARSILDSLYYIELRHIEEPEKFLFKKYECGHSVSEIHLHSTVGWGVPFLCDDEFWQREHRRSLEYDCVIFPSSTDSLLITLAHTFYEDKSFSMANVLRVAACLKASDIDWDYARWVVSTRGWEDAFRESLGCYQTILNRLNISGIDLPSMYTPSSNLKAASDKLTDYPVQYSFLDVKRFYYRKIWNDTLRTKKQKLYDSVSTFCWGVEVKLNLFFQRPFVIAFSGIDGSGKSTQIKALRSAFENCAIKNETIWFRCFCSPVSISLQKFLRKKVVNQASTDSKRLDRKSGKGIISYLERTFAAIELIYIYAIKVRFLKLFDRVIFIDRCLLDMAVELNLRYPDAPLTGSFLWRLLKWFSVEPDIHVFLDMDSSEAEGRQTEESQEMLKKMEAGYQHILDDYKVTIISARQNIDQIAQTLYFQTMKKYFRNWNLISKKILLATRRQMNPSIREDE